MRIGLIGSGEMSASLGRRWVALGHAVMVGGRNPDNARRAAASLGSGTTAGSLVDAAEFGDVLLLAIRWEGALAAAEEIAPVLDGSPKPLLDCTNPVEVDDFSVVTRGTSMAEQIEEAAPGAQVVKAFNLCHASVWGMDHPIADGRSLQVPVCGDHAVAKEAAAGLVSALGCTPLDLGPLRRARHLEAMAAVVIQLLFTGSDPATVLALTRAEPARS